jgi:Tol biopolymer transport system component
MDLLRVDAVNGTCVRSPLAPDGSEPMPSCSTIQPLLDSAVLRVRSIGAQGSMTADPHIGVRFSGTDANHRFGADGPWYERLFPFQADHRAEHAMLFRPSWAPDGERIAYSDGLSLRVWRIGEATAAVVPNTADGVSAAWSPDGLWIAFGWIPRTDSIVYTCVCAGATPIQAFRTVYSEGPRTVVIIRPDGTGRMELGPGDDPAWSPDGSQLYVRRDNDIVRIPLAGGTAITVPRTTGGRAPAVSPDGSRLAFSRRKSQLVTDYDIWVVSLNP